MKKTRAGESLRSVLSNLENPEYWINIFKKNMRWKYWNFPLNWRNPPPSHPFNHFREEPMCDQIFYFFQTNNDVPECLRWGFAGLYNIEPVDRRSYFAQPNVCLLPCLLTFYIFNHLPFLFQSTQPEVFAILRFFEQSKLVNNGRRMGGRRCLLAW